MTIDVSAPLGATLGDPRGGPANPRAALGRYGEELAARFLRDRGLVVLDRNWRCELGEIDIVALDGDCLVVCEVKTRRGVGFGDPIEGVTWAKAARLRRLAGAYVQAQRAVGAAWVADGAALRIDVIGVLRPDEGPARVRHIVGVGT